MLPSQRLTRGNEARYTNYSEQSINKKMEWFSIWELGRANLGSWGVKGSIKVPVGPFSSQFDTQAM